MIEVLDFKGDWWTLMPDPVYVLPATGEAKFWATVCVDDDGNIPIKDYPKIPLPVFNARWPA